MSNYHDTDEYVSKKDYEKIVQENQHLKKECTFLRNQMKEIYINCTNIIKVIKK